MQGHRITVRGLTVQEAAEHLLDHLADYAVVEGEDLGSCVVVIVDLVQAEIVPVDGPVSSAVVWRHEDMPSTLINQYANLAVYAQLALDAELATA